MKNKNDLLLHANINSREDRQACYHTIPDMLSSSGPTTTGWQQPVQMYCSTQR